MSGRRVPPELTVEHECACGCRTVLTSPRRFAVKHSRKRLRPPGWRGGRFKHPHGYILVQVPDHPRADVRGYVPEHILVVEDRTGISVPRSAQIHHVNGDKADNRPENLVVCQDIAYHKLLHLRQKALDAGCPAHFRMCMICKRYGDPSDMRRQKVSFVHAQCRNAALADLSRIVAGRRLQGIA
jgi:hypothetical protein